MNEKLPTVTESVITTLLDAALPRDEFFLEYVTDIAHMQCLFSCDRKRIRDSLMLRPKGQTALIDGLYLAVQEMTKAHHPNRAVVLVSDGGDNESLYKFEELELVERTGGYRVNVINEPEATVASAHMALAARAPYVLHFAIPQTHEIKSLRHLKVDVHGVRPAPRVFYGIAYDAKSGLAVEVP